MFLSSSAGLEIAIHSESQRNTFDSSLCSFHNVYAVLSRNKLGYRVLIGVIFHFQLDVCDVFTQLGKMIFLRHWKV